MTAPIHAHHDVRGIPARSLRQAALCCLLLVLHGLAGAQEYHVALSGSDGASGASTAPWRSIGHAAGRAAAGDTVVIHAGTYLLAEQIAFANSGSAGTPITYRANSGDSVLIDGGTGRCLSLQFRSHLIFQDLHFTTGSTAVGACMVYMEGTNHCQFLGCTFSDMPAENGAENTSAVRCMQTGGAGQSVGCIFRDNLFTDCLSPALRLYDTNGWIIENNEFVNCQQAVGGKDKPDNMLVRRNRITGGRIAFYFAAQSGCSDVTITENIVVGAEIGFQVGGLGTYGNLRDDIKLYNNTFYECSHLITGWDDAFTRRQSYHSNIFLGVTAKNIPAGADTAGRFVNLDKYGSVAVDPAYYTMDWNCLRVPAGDTSLRFVDAHVRAQTIAAWSAAHPPFEAHSIADDPQFVDAAAGDFRLQAGSPCRGAGRYGQDMGAYPRGSDATVIGRRAGGGPSPPPAGTAGGGGSDQDASSSAGGCGAGGLAGMGLLVAALAGLRRSRTRD
ncbi:MAG: right-handed parallel beta-helix repeat-containing protein [Planctomycetes bacterium]|nr:right-handed parallel beta-helix repeat-containing protein [Planctomycetota bacterium]